MVDISYYIPDMSLLNFIPVRPLPLQVSYTYTTDNMFPFQDSGSAVFLEAQRVACNHNTSFHHILHLQEKPQRQRWAPDSPRPTTPPNRHSPLPRVRFAGLVEDLRATLFSLDGRPTLCCHLGCTHCQGLASLQWCNLLQSQAIFHEVSDDPPWPRHYLDAV